MTTLGLASRQGSTPWPPTRQTVTKRYGGWTEALEQIGLGTAAKGRPKGLVKFAEQDYDDSMRIFLLMCSQQGKNATFVAYDEWVDDQALMPFDLPSGSSIRNYYGTWAQAIRSVQG